MTAARPTRMRNLMTWGALGEASYVAGQFVVLVALARFTGVDTVGAFGLSNAILWPIVASLSFGLRVNYATDHGRAFSFPDMLALRLAACALALALVAAIAFGALAGEARAILLIYGAAKVVEMLSDLSFGVFQRAGRMALVTRSLALRSLGVALAVGVLLALGVPTALALLPYLAIWGAAALALDLPAAVRLARADGTMRPASWAQVRRLIAVSLPLWITGTLAAVQGNVPRYVVGASLGLAALGQFTVVAYVMQAVFSLFYAIADSVVSRLAQYAARADRAAFTASMIKLGGIVAAFACATLPLSYFAGDAAIRLAFGSDYAGLGGLLTLLLLAAVLNAGLTVVQAALEANRAFRAIAVSRTVFLLVLTAAGWAGAAWHGLMGVGYALCLVHLGQMAVQLVLLVRQPLFRDG